MGPVAQTSRATGRGAESVCIFLLALCPAVFSFCVPLRGNRDVVALRPHSFSPYDSSEYLPRQMSAPLAGWTRPCCLSHLFSPAQLFSLCVSVSTATRGSHHGLLRRGSGAGGLRRHVLQQLLPLPAVHSGPGPEQRCQLMGAE